MGKFARRAEQEKENLNKTLPLPVTCQCCGFELPSDAEKNDKYFVNFLVCLDKNRNCKRVTGVPSQFLEVDANGRIKGSSDDGYVLRKNYDFFEWVVWCVRCHSKKTMLADKTKKTNQSYDVIAKDLGRKISRLQQKQGDLNYDKQFVYSSGYTRAKL